MTDREKVIRGLECCTAGTCDGCPYEGDEDLRGGCIKRTQVDALEIIREDGERTADPIFDGRGWSCGACGEIYRDVLDAALYRHCPGCGRRLIWVKETETCD